jgi:hypothetical protein
VTVFKDMNLKDSEIPTICSQGKMCTAGYKRYVRIKPPYKIREKDGAQLNGWTR